MPLITPPWEDAEDYICVSGRGGSKMITDDEGREQLRQSTIRYGGVGGNPMPATSG